MVGHTTPNTATIWAYDSKARELAIAWWPDEAGPETAKRATIDRADGTTPVFRKEITGLKPATRYRYVLRAKEGEATRGSFITPPPAGKPAAFRYVLTSCMDFKRFPEQPAWDEVIRQKPDFHLLVGDNVYSDSTDYDVIVDHHLKQRAVPNFAALLANVPTYATWDDHDYGPNNSHGATPGKEHSLRAFKDLWANPACGTPDIPGVFHTFQWADVQFFVMDGRYHRTDEAAPNKPGKTQFGTAQLQWLFDGLKNSRATFKVVATGYDVMGSRYPEEVKIIARHIRENRIPGVLFNSGDIHRNEFKQQDHGMGYPITQITSSGIGRHKMRPWAMIDIDTTLDDPMVTARFFAKEKLDRTHRIRLSELAHPRR